MLQHLFVYCICLCARNNYDFIYMIYLKKKSLFYVSMNFFFYKKESHTKTVCVHTTTRRHVIYVLFFLILFATYIFFIYCHGSRICINIDIFYVYTRSRLIFLGNSQDVKNMKFSFSYTFALYIPNL